MRRLAGALFVVVGAGLLLSGGWAAAGPADPVSQDVAAGGDADGLLVFGSRSRNDSCSVTRNVLNRTDGEVAVRVLSSGGQELDARTVGAGGQVTFVIHHDVVTVPLLLQAGGEAPVELAQVGPFPPCDEQPATTVPPTTVPPTTGPTTAPPATTPSTTVPTTAPSSTVPEPTVTTLSPPTTAPSTGPSTTTSAPSVAPATTPTSRVASAPPVSVLSAQVGGPSISRLPTTGADTRPTVVLGLSSIAVGAAFLLSARTARAAGRRRSA